MDAPQIRFCTSEDGTRIAYFTLGAGRPFVLPSGWAGIEAESNHPDVEAYRQAMSQRRVFVEFDRRGLGSSQREVSDFSLEAHVGDLAAVVDHLHLERFDLFGSHDATAVAIAYAAQHPERVSRLVLWTPYPWGKEIARPEALTANVELIRGNWGLARRAIADVMYPTGPLELQRWVAHSLRQALSSEAAAEYMRFRFSVDIRPYLPQVKTPTLVLHRRANRNVPISASRTVAALIRDARFVALEGDIDDWWHGHEQYMNLMMEFLDEGQAPEEPPSGTAIILFADIADSTALTERLGDAAFREKARELDESLRKAIASNGGTAIEGKLLGDGVLAVFGAAREAIACAGAIHGMAGSGAKGQGPRSDEEPLLLHIGIHAGDVIREAGNVYGGAVNIAARVAGEAAAGETLVSGTVRDLARTSAGVSFEDRGERSLKGVGEPVRVWGVQEPGSKNQEQG